MAVVTLSARLRENGEQREAAHKAKMQEIAKLVVGTHLPPDWVRELLSDWSFEVKWSDTMEGMLPTREELSVDLDSAEKLAGELSKLLASPMLTAFLVTGAGKSDQNYINEGRNFLSMLAGDIQKAKKSPRLVGADGELLSGAGRPHLPGNKPPKYVCAAIIAEVWSFFHPDQKATAYKRAIQVAAAQYYEAWFPSEKGWGNSPLKGWEYYLKSIGHDDLQGLRKEVRRILESHRVSFGK